jgi:hypothetical protein
VRGVELARAAYGASLLAAPGTVVRMVSGEAADRLARVGARILGARHLVQAAFVGRSGHRLLLVAGAATDALHALSMVALATFDTGHRRLASFDAAVASLFMLNGALEARRA